MDRRRLSLAAGAGVAAAAASVLARGLWFEVRRTAVRRRTLHLPGWPAELDGLRVALVGDLHAGAPHVGVARVRRIAELLARRRPELLLVVGDLVDHGQALGHDVAPEPVAQALARVAVPRVAVLGNHDRSYGGSRVAAALRAARFAVLQDEPLALRVRGRELWIVGLDDAASGDPHPRRAFAGIPDGAPVLALTHSPDVFPRVPARAALTVAGHTHGAQVALPGLRARIIPSRHGDRYAAGHVVEGGRHLFVTRGVGTSRFPVRLGARAEVVLLTLRPAARGRIRRRWPASSSPAP